MGLESESQSSVAACWFSIAATTALEFGVSGARPEVITSAAEGPFSRLFRIAETIWNDPTPSSPLSSACISGTGPAMRAPATCVRSFFSIASMVSCGSENSISA